MYFSAKDKGEMMSMIYNWPGHLCFVLVPDQMVNKARLCSSLPLTYHGYMASSVLLVVMIVLTDGSRILGLGDLGVQGIGTPIGKVDMYVAAAGINPQRFEDFQMKWAFERLQWYQKRFCMFNDDMQGTAGVALAGLLGTIRALGRPLTDFVNQKIVVVGAGSAGLGVFNMAAQAVSRMAGAEARSHYKARKGVDPAAAPFAKAPGEIEGLGLREGANLVEVVKKVKPHVLLGLTGVGSVFTKCTAVDAFNHAEENIVFPSGSPFKNVNLGMIGMGVLLSSACLISDEMSEATSECIQDIAAEVRAAVVLAAVAEELAEGRCDVGPRELR
ncbi:hypothetical protein TEA_006959 [Camellia sinensis var. sinensis]|uniref:Malic enzyme n=1 Tax=Camellia sinensis var. sinensis TaxID=542762 RepID=A0A4S4DZQ8_CAMSN|nr:hypothetical protein TEA_006959 [Camellia sinensis var. sinensis]